MKPNYTDGVPCLDFRPCYFRHRGDCPILSDTKFPDGKCHFRKTEVDGKNLYDHPEEEMNGRTKNIARGAGNRGSVFGK